MMDKKALMENLARESFEKGGLNGAWLYAEKGEIVSKGALGWCDPENTRPLTEDTIFQLASVSKQFTASAVMLIVRQGLLGLDDKLVRYFPELTCRMEQRGYYDEQHGVYWCSSCGAPWQFEYDGPAGNGWKICPRCGARIEDE